VSSHVAPWDWRCTLAPDFPENYRNGAFVGEHGSWNRTPLNGYKSCSCRQCGKPSGPAQDVVPGFLDANNQARGRPVGLASTRAAHVDRRRRRKHGLAGVRFRAEAGQFRPTRSIPWSMSGSCMPNRTIGQARPAWAQRPCGRTHRSHRSDAVSDKCTSANDDGDLRGVIGWTTIPVGSA